MTARRTIVFHNGALGDLLLSVPALQTIRACSDAVHLAGRPDAARLLKDLGCVDEAFDAGSPFFTSLYTGRGDRKVRSFLSGFDRAFVFATRIDSVCAGNVQEHVPHGAIILTLPPEASGMHVAAFRARQTAFAVGLAEDQDVDTRPRFTFPSCRAEEARRLLEAAGHTFGKPLIGIHPGSGGARKCWPLGKYVRLVGTFQTVYDAFVVLLSGPAEGMEVRDTLAELSRTGKGIIHVHDRDLLTVAAILGLCDLYVGNDSGISHLASLMNGKGVVIFGPTDPLLWRPLGAGVCIVASSERCAPCGDERSRRCLDRSCLAAISVTDVMAEAAKCTFQLQ